MQWKRSAATLCCVIIRFNTFRAKSASERSQFRQVKRRISWAALITELVLFMNAERTTWELIFFRTSLIRAHAINLLIIFFPASSLLLQNTRTTIKINQKDSLTCLCCVCLGRTQSICCVNKNVLLVLIFRSKGRKVGSRNEMNLLWSKQQLEQKNKESFNLHPVLLSNESSNLQI